MDEYFLQLVMGALFCLLPAVVVLGGIALLVRYLRTDRDEARVGEPGRLEGAVQRLRDENRALESRLCHLEASFAEMSRVLGVDVLVNGSGARETTIGAERVGEGLDVAHASVRGSGVEPRAAAELGGRAPEASRADLQSGAWLKASAGTGSGVGVESDAELVTAGAVAMQAVIGPADADSTAGLGASDAVISRAPDAIPPDGEVADASRAAGDGRGGAGGSGSPAAGEPSGIQWEQWIGVRGAAALGASILLLAGIYFFEYSIEHELITPAMRMVAGTLVGVGCLLAAELRLRRTHAVLANWLAGAGIGILYVAFWAGRALYALYPTWAASVLLLAVTATCVTLAVRRDASAIAVVGLLGGFATPLALSSGSDRPIPLFGYLLLLDGAMLWVAYRRRWPWMALLCLLATAAYQNAWLIGRLDEPRLLLGVLIVAVFAILFAALPKSAEPGREGEEHPIWKLTRSAGVLLPLLATVPLAMRQDLGATFWPTAVQLALLTVVAGWVGMRHRSVVLPTGASLIASGVLLGWSVAHPPHEPDDVWKLASLAIALAAVHHVAGEVGRLRELFPASPRSSVLSAAVTNVSFLVIAALAAPGVASAGPWPWLVLWAVLVVSTARLASAADELSPLQSGAAALSSLGMGVTFAAQVGREGQPSAGLFVGVWVAAAILMQLGGLLPRADVLRRQGDHAGALFALVLAPTLPLAQDVQSLPAWAMYGATLVLAVLALLVAARRAFAGWMVAALSVTALAHGIWILRHPNGPFGSVDLAALATAALLFSAFPIVAPRLLRERAWSWRTAALAGPLYLLLLRHVWLRVWGASAIGLLPLLLGVVCLGAAYAVRARGPAAGEARKVALVWLTASAAGFVTLAIPLQLNNEWITIGWALEALAMTALWRRFDHPGLKYLAFALAGAVCVRLMANPYVFGYYPRSELRVFNWLTYTYLVPAGALLGMWALLRGQEIERRRSIERSIFPDQHAVLANLAATFAIGIVFGWLNLTIFDWFAVGPRLSIPLERLPARDLSLSIAWAVFALVLLGIGMWRRSTALRALSLALILATSGKVFLYDLAHLSDLYRVASLVGLALSLIVISLAYQRFVFRKSREEVRS